MDLLEYLASMLQCSYLSDLRYIDISPEQARRVLDFPPERFPLQEYEEALRYLSGEAPSFARVEDAKAALAEGLQMHSKTNF